MQRKTADSSNDAAIKAASPLAKRTASRTAQATRATTAPHHQQTAEPHRDLLSWRKEFPILQRKTYLNSCSLGALSTRSMAGMTRFQELWNEYGASAWYKLWLGEIAEVRQKFAQIIGAQPHEIAIAPNVSAALSQIATGLDLGERNRVVMADLDFPTLAYQWMAKQRLGVEVEFVESPDRVTVPTERFEDAIDERVGLVATSRVFYLSGYMQDIATLARRAHQQGALILIDDYQGTGQIPIDVKALDVDFLVTGTLKWLMGGPGLAFIYVREELIPKLRPSVTGWWGSRDMFEFRTGVFEYRDDAQRLEAGTPALAPIFAANASLDIVLEIGVERIRERTRWLADDLVRRVQERGWKLLSPADGAVRSSIVMLGMEQPEALVSSLAQRGIIVDSRPGRLRISPHFYNTVEENELIISTLDELLASRGK
ncbi:MAG TPA: aminotransferase class V-fold PLP-dependent enzyme [Ktedonobacterales bacterium]|nr:aminotransferase class V-fold PLP-dependent enzyme [Ktedonobacterales bacterium]